MCPFHVSWHLSIVGVIVFMILMISVIAVFYTLSNCVFRSSQGIYLHCFHSPIIRLVHPPSFCPVNNCTFYYDLYPPFYVSLHTFTPPYSFQSLYVNFSLPSSTSIYNIFSFVSIHFHQWSHQDVVLITTCYVSPFLSLNHHRTNILSSWYWFAYSISHIRNLLSLSNLKYY